MVEYPGGAAFAVHGSTVTLHLMAVIVHDERIPHFTVISAQVDICSLTTIGIPSKLHFIPTGHTFLCMLSRLLRRQAQSKSPIWVTRAGWQQRCRQYLPLENWWLRYVPTAAISVPRMRLTFNRRCRAVRV